MNILFLTRLYLPHVGGVEKHIQNLSKALQLKGCSVTVLTTIFDKSLKNKERKENIKIIRFNQPNIKYLGILSTWVWLFKNRKLIEDADIVHVHDVFIWYWPFRLFYPKKRVFVTNHGQWGNYPLSISDKIQKKISRLFSSGVISIGKYIDKNYGIKSDVISYGAVENFKYESKPKEGVLLYVGRLDRNTGLTTFLDLLRQYSEKLKDQGLNIIFCGDGGLRNECVKYGEVLGWGDPDKYYKKAKFVFASGYLTILEAFANKCLVLTGYTNKIKKDYYKLTPFNEYIFGSDDPKEIYKKIISLSKNKSQAQKLTEKGYNWVQDQTWEKMAKNYLSIWSR